MKTWLSVLLLAGATALALLPGLAASRPPAAPLRISPIDAAFDQARFETDYSVEVLGTGGNAELRQAVRDGKVKATWTLHLKLVDAESAHPPGRPDEGAEVDLACTNAGVGLPNHPYAEAVDRKDEDTDFRWHYPNGTAADRYHCDHTKMGPRGHQGLVTVVLTDGAWMCEASYKGTNDSNRSSLKNGTASEPVCRRMRG